MLKKKIMFRLTNNSRLLFVMHNVEDIW